MPQAHADPEEIEKFASTLASYRQESEESAARLREAFHALGDTWNDQEKIKFEAVFEEFSHGMTRFLQDSEPYAPYLRSKAAKLREYLGG
jgi:uncharacterized protein YukE